jgi:hypothetical protein
VGSIRHFRELEVFQLAMAAAMKLFELSKRFPLEEKYSLSDAEAEAAESQVWIEFAVKCGYLDPEVAVELDKSYDFIQCKLVTMLTHPEKWRIH